MASREGLFTSLVCLSLKQMNESVVMGKSQFPFEVVTLLTFVMSYIPYIETASPINVAHCEKDDASIIPKKTVISK